MNPLIDFQSNLDRAVLLAENQRLREQIADLKAERDTDRMMKDRTIVSLCAHIIRLRYGWYTPAKEAEMYHKLLAQADDARRFTAQTQGRAA